MRTRMFAISVYNEGGNVCLEQRSDHGEDDLIVLSPEQAELVCAWIMEAASEAKEV